MDVEWLAIFEAIRHFALDHRFATPSCWRKRYIPGHVRRRARSEKFFRCEGVKLEAKPSMGSRVSGRLWQKYEIIDDTACWSVLPCKQAFELIQDTPGRGRSMSCKHEPIKMMDPL